jgi:hypothetical protein
MTTNNPALLDLHTIEQSAARLAALLRQNEAEIARLTAENKRLIHIVKSNDVLFDRIRAALQPAPAELGDELRAIAAGDTAGSEGE